MGRKKRKKQQEPRKPSAKERRRRRIGLAVALVAGGGMILASILNRRSHLRIPTPTRNILGEWELMHGAERLARLRARALSGEFQVPDEAVERQLVVLRKSRLLVPLLDRVRRRSKARSWQVERALAGLGVRRARGRGSELATEEGLLAELNGPDLDAALLAIILRPRQRPKSANQADQSVDSRALPPRGMIEGQPLRR